jgi:hypothetical protein
LWQREEIQEVLWDLNCLPWITGVSSGIGAAVKPGCSIDCSADKLVAVRQSCSTSDEHCRLVMNKSVNSWVTIANYRLIS